MLTSFLLTLVGLVVLVVVWKAGQGAVGALRTHVWRLVDVVVYSFVALIGLLLLADVLRRFHP
jgi:hypothetical protein